MKKFEIAIILLCIILLGFMVFKGLEKLHDSGSTGSQNIDSTFAQAVIDRHGMKGINDTINLPMITNFIGAGNIHVSKKCKCDCEEEFNDTTGYPVGFGAPVGKNAYKKKSK